MTVSVVQSKFTTHTVTAPSATLNAAPTAGNVVVAVAYVADTSANTTTPAGFTDRVRKDAPAIGACAVICERVVQAGDSATVTFGGTTQASCVGLYELAGVKTTGEYDNGSSATTGGALTIQAPSVSPGAPYEFFVVVDGNNVGVTRSIDSGFTLDANVSAGGANTGISHKIKTDSTAEAPTVTYNISISAVIAMAAFKPVTYSSVVRFPARQRALMRSR